LGKRFVLPLDMLTGFGVQRIEHAKVRKWGRGPLRNGPALFY
jgi:hypothetical protein